MKCIVLLVLMVIFSMMKVYSVGNCVYIYLHTGLLLANTLTVSSALIYILHNVYIYGNLIILFLFKVIYSHFLGHTYVLHTFASFPMSLYMLCTSWHLLTH